jgi:L-iditol 2-dehydrogenase
MVVNQRRMIAVSNDIAPACAAFLEPFSAALHGLRKGHVLPGENVVIIGGGTMGLVNAQTAHALGARVIITEIDPYKLERAKSMAIADVIDSRNSDPVEEVKRLTGGKGADVVVPCVGLSSAYKQAYNMLRKAAGRFIIYSAGYPAPEFPADMVNSNKVHYNKLDIIGTIGANSSDCADASRFISNRLVKPELILQLNKPIPLRDIQKAYEFASTPGTFRISVDLQGV